MKSASLFALSLLCGTAVASFAHAQENAEEKALRQVEATLCDAFRNSDAATIQRIEDEHYTLTDSRGGVTGRARSSFLSALPSAVRGMTSMNSNVAGTS